MSFQTLIAGVILLGGLVFFHELGHFVVAKLFKVKILKFSLGFGPRIFGFKKGETEYQVAALPLGGFVRMAGQDPADVLAPEDKGRGFMDQSPLRRALIAFAGPGVNLLLPIIVFTLIYLAPQRSEPPLVGVLIPGEPAERAGVLPGDRIVEVAGVPVRSFSELREEVQKRGGEEVQLVVDRLGQRLTLTLTPTSETENNPVESTQKGRIGIIGARLPSYVGVIPHSRASHAGLQNFDQIVEVNGVPTPSSRELLQQVHDIPEGTALQLKVLRPRPLPLRTVSLGTVDELSLEIPAGEGELGLDEPDLYFREVEKDSAAWKAGLRPGDKLVEFNSEPIRSRVRLGYIMGELDSELKTGKAELSMVVERAAPEGSEQATERVALSFSPPVKDRRDRMLGMVTEPDFGFGFDQRVFIGLPTPDSEMVSYSYTFPQALSRAVTQTVDLARVMVLGIAGLFTGKVSTETIGGPIMLFQVAGEVAKSGISDFLRLFGLISINLGLVNLLPVPILDGFHIVVSGLEVVSRRPVSARFREVANYIGLALLLALMVLAFKNDIVRTFAN